MQTSLLNKNTSTKTYLEEVRDKVQFYGTDGASISDLLAVIIGKNDPSICSQLASLSVRELLGMTKADFQQIDGIGKRVAEQLEAAIALGARLTNESLPEYYTIRSPEDVMHYNGVQALRHEQQEKFKALFLDTKNHVIGEKVIFVGSLNASIVHPRELFKEAVKRSAASVIVAHNHPSGNAEPSHEDIEVTKRLVQCGKMLGVDVLDHLIVGDGRFTSLKEKGYM